MNDLDPSQLTQYEQIFQEKGYQNSSLDVILRQAGDALKQFSSTNIVFPNELSLFIPMGNPPSLNFGYKRVGDDYFGSVFISSDIAMHLKLQGNESDKLEHLISFYSTIESGFSNLFTYFGNSTLDHLESLEVKQNQYNLDKIAKLQNFDTLLYSLLTKQSTTIIGPREDILNLLQVLIEILPDNIKRTYNVTMNIPYIDSQFDLACVDNGSLKNIEISTFLDNDYNIIDLNELVCYGEYTSSYTAKIARSLQTGNLDETKKQISHLWKLVGEIQGEDIDDIVETSNIEYDDAELIMQMQEVHVRGDSL